MFRNERLIASLPIKLYHSWWLFAVDIVKFPCVLRPVVLLFFLSRILFGYCLVPGSCLAALCSCVLHLACGSRLLEFISVLVAVIACIAVWAQVLYSMLRESVARGIFRTIVRESARARGVVLGQSLGID